MAVQNPGEFKVLVMERSRFPMRSPCGPPSTPSLKSSDGPGHTTTFDDTSHEVSSSRLAATATLQDIVHGQENLSLNLTQAQSGSPCSEVTIPEVDPLAQNQIRRMSAIPQVAKVSDRTLAGNLISGSGLGYTSRSLIQAHQGSSMADPVNATIAGAGPGYQHSPHDRMLQVSISQMSLTAGSTSATLAAGAGDSYPFPPQYDLQAMQVYRTSSMVGFTSATFAGVGASYPFPPQYDPQAMQIYRTSPMAGFTSATLAAGAGTGYPFPPQQGSQMHVSVSQASSMAHFVNATLDGNTNAACVFSPPLQAADPVHVQHRDIHWTFGTYEERPPNQRYSADEKTTIRCLLENGLSHSKIKKLTGSPKATTNRFSRKSSQVQMIRIQSTKLQGTYFFVLRVCPKLELTT
ncbi:MAG: hypothetical protein J3Q66DRAFT_374677 [Benniella sp.]|nr:MAG: hypothetical protein J3Q66DRAFT_374677 [Benniella sp.]